MHSKSLKKSPTRGSFAENLYLPRREGKGKTGGSQRLSEGHFSPNPRGVYRNGIRTPVHIGDGMKQLAKNKKFIYALLVFWLLQGVYFTLTTLMEPILQFFNGGSMDSLFIGTLGTILTVTGVITTLVLPIASDRSKSKKRKPIVLVCEIGTLVGLVLIITGHTVGLQILMACCLGIFLTGVTPIVMVLGYESAYPVSEGTTESLMQLGANGWGLICLLAVNGIFQGNHMGTLVFFLASTVLSLVLTMMIKEASLKERRIE